MKKWMLVLFFLLFVNGAYASDKILIALEKPKINLNDQESIKRGAKFFAANCMSCHSLTYMRYDKIAKETGVLYEKMPLNVTKWPLDVRPPDLSLEISIRGASWVYTYLHSFYVDAARPLGAGNLILPHTAMPDILMPYQGQQVRIPEAERKNKIYYHEDQWYDLLKLQSHGSMTPEQFDATMTDLVNFLAYASEPYKAKQEWIGAWVIGFLVVLFVLVYLLKSEYWKDIEGPK
jgi:ubiquinol-cytochrome c reductase cytochrome c1 subunit